MTSLSNTKPYFKNQLYRTATKHSFKHYHLKIVNKIGPRLDMRKKLFTRRVINHLNDLPLEVKEAEDVHIFKIIYDAFYIR